MGRSSRTPSPTFCARVWKRLRLRQSGSGRALSSRKTDGPAHRSSSARPMRRRGGCPRNNYVNWKSSLKPRKTLNDSAYLFDSSIWVAITFSSHPAHDMAMSALAKTTADCPACFCRATQQSFLRLITTPAILAAYGATAMTNSDALRVHDELQALANVAYRPEPADIESSWPKQAARATASPKLWMDAYLAAFAIKADLTLV